MEEEIKKLIELLKNKNQTISMMESCTGGELASSITNEAGASGVFEFGAVTYSERAKIIIGGNKMKETIAKHSVYSKETAEVMAEAIALFANATYGIGITGRLEENINEVDVSIFNSMNQSFFTKRLNLENIRRTENKKIIVKYIINKLMQI